MPQDKADGRFVRVCALSELKNGQRRVADIEGRPVLLLRMGEQVHALRNRCTHMDYPLDTGRQIGFEIICRTHGARFDIRDGRALGGPAVRRLEIYETRVVDGFVEIGVKQQPDRPIWPF